MRELKRLVSESRTENRAVSSFEVAQFDKGATNDMMEVVADERKGSSLIVGSAEKESFEVF